jgi:hypothetical protein
MSKAARMPGRTKLIEICHVTEMKMELRNSKNRILRESQGAITIFDVLPLYAIIIGIVAGAKLGTRFGHGGAIICGIVGGVLGFFCWRLFLMSVCKWLDRKRNLNHKTVEELRAMLRDPNCKSPRLVLLELGIKGEKMENYLPTILDLLVSPLAETRRRGWLTLVSVFPERAKIISDYRIDDSIEKCREKIQKLLPVQI